MSSKTSTSARYLYSVLVVAVALITRILLVPWTGQGAPFVLFFGAVVVSGFLWGVGPGMVSGLIAAPIAAYLFVIQAHYTVSQAVAQSIVFLVEVWIVCVLANRFAEAKRRSEVNERAARQAEAEVKKWQNIFEKADWGVAVADPKSDTLEMLNPAFASMLGYESAEILRKRVSDVTEPNSRAGLADHFRKADEAGHHSFESVFRRKDGCTFPAMTDVTSVKDQQGHVLYRALNLRDLTEIHQARLYERDARARVEAVNAALQKSEAELREAQRLAHLGNWSWDAISDTVKWSEEVYSIFGWNAALSPPNFYEGHPKLFNPDSMARLKAAVDKTLKDGIPYEIELELVHPKGDRRWISARGEPTRNVSGNIIGLYGTVQDITQLKQLQRMREEWTSVIAHDLRQPIGVIAMSADILLSFHDGAITEIEESVIRRIRSGALSLARMVDDLLDLSRLEAQRLNLEKKWINPRTVVRETVERLSPTASSFRVRISETGDLTPVFADPVRVEQILGNLFSNAVKYGEPGTEILVGLDRRDHEVQISVTNHGCGIQPADLPRLFDRFFRSKAGPGPSVPGLGLGLYISKGLVEEHGGRIWVESVPGDQTTFHFTLPVRADEEQGVT